MTGPGWDWDPRDPTVQRDQVAAFDDIRERCPIAHSEVLGWSVMRHEDVLAVLDDHATFSSRVSAHVALPNGLDPPEHTAYRAVIDACFTPDLVASFAPKLRDIARTVLAVAMEADVVEVMSAIAEPFAAQALCAYVGWPVEVARALQAWSADSARATLAGDRGELSRVAERFDRIIVEMLDRQRANGPQAPATVTGLLQTQLVDGIPLTDGQLVSILRNWTVGEVGTIAASIGIIVEFLARRPDIQGRMRDVPDGRQTVMDEVLRLEPPLIANRRRTTRAVTLHGRTIPADEPVSIVWPAAQRDPRVHLEPAGYRSDRDARSNLLYGRGPHACPGEGLARLELGVLVDALLAMAPAFSLAPATAPARATYPAGGFTSVSITLAGRGRWPWPAST